METINNIHLIPFKANTSANGSDTFKAVYETIPVKTNAKIIKTTVQIINE